MRTRVGTVVGLVVGLIAAGAGLVSTAPPSAGQTAPLVDLAMSIVVPGGQAPPGGALNWSLRLTNHGPNASSGYTVTVEVPAGSTNVSTNSTGCSAVGTTVTCVGSSLGPGSFAQVFVSTNAPVVPLGTMVTTTASVVGADDDPDLANNDLTASKLVAYRPVCLATSFKLALIDPASVPLDQCQVRSARGVGVNQPLVPGLPVALAAILPSVSAYGFAADTTATEFGASAGASASLAGLTLNIPGVISLVVGAVSSSVSIVPGASCADPVTKSSHSHIGSLVVNGKPYVVGDQPLTIPLGTAGALHLNRTFELGSVIGREALVLELSAASPANRLVIGESRAAYGGCSSG